MIWSQWNDLKLPKSLKSLSTNGKAPSPEDFDKITLYVPLYMGGAAAIADIPKMSSLKVVQSLLAGVEDLEQIVPENVLLCNAAGVHDESTAELAIGLAIATRRGFAQFASNQHKGVWIHSRNSSLTDSNIAIVGYGSIGKNIEKKLSSFDVSIEIFTRSGHDGTTNIAEFDGKIGDFDVVILILPLNTASHNFMNSTRLAKMKNGSSLINVARGGIVDTDALFKELHSGRISAGLDVTNPEPLPEHHPLWGSPNLIITPHVGGDSEAFERRGRALVEFQAQQFAEGRALKNVVTRN
jgi:phosphoglycerate dehydrogenase-like enzyme